MVNPSGMLTSLRKNQLVKKGFACNKTRRRLPRNEFLRSLETSAMVRTAIFAGFLFALAGLIFFGSKSGQAQQFLFAMLVFCTAAAQLWINHPQTFLKNSRLVLLFGSFLVHLLIIKGMLVAIESRALNPSFGDLLFPFAFAPLIISALLGKNQGIYAVIFVSLWGSILWSLVDAVFLAMSLISGFVAVFVTLQVRRRGQFVRAGFYVGVATWLLALSFGLIKISWLEMGDTNWKLIGFQSLAAVGGGLLTAIIVSGTLPVLEQAFHITTAMSWLELTDLNHPLLMRLSLEAPGTYEHSQAVARLAEAAAERIGANAAMCRTCAYYHDIGKLVKPEYFTENMRSTRNPHDDLAPTMSALILIAHVKEGVDLALKHKLNPRIIDVIQQHHGDSLVYYFYKRALQQQEDARAGGKIMNLREDDIPEVTEESFRYSGPRPQTKESAIISLADAVESASRSLEKPTLPRIEELVSNIIDARVADHQLSDCDLTFSELGEVTESFCFTLKSMLHRRIAYPSKKESPATEGGASSRERRRTSEFAPARVVA